MSALRPRVEIGNDRRAHYMVLRALPEADVEVKRKVLLTGRPGSGKTTLIKRVVDKLSLPACGFYTDEIRERGQRVGFRIVTLAGEEAVLAHVDYKTGKRVGKYGLDLSGLETIGVAALRSGIAARKLVVIDEIGPMEIQSRIFCDAVIEALDSNALVLGTISVRSFPFTNTIKERHDVRLIEVRPNNRKQLVSELSERFAT
jgi:nucleoside-triphosphatase